MLRFPLLLLLLLAPLGLSAAGEPLAVPAAAHGHGHGAAVGQAELGAQAAFDADGVLWAVHRVSGHIAVSRSTDAGASWSSPVLVTPSPEPIDSGGDARPKIALGPAGEIYVSWTRPLAEPYTGEIRLSRSLDAGRTFSAPIVVHQDRQVITHRFDALAVNRRGQVFVAWIDKRDRVRAGGTDAAYPGAALYFAVSDDHGASFRGDYKVADHSCECCRIALAIDADGNAVAFWRHIFSPNIRDHAVARLYADGRAEALRQATFEHWQIDGCPHHGPALAIDASGVRHAVWFSGAPEHRGVFYGRLGDGAPAGLRRIGSDAAGHADIAADGKRVAIAWKDSNGGNTVLLGATSDDDGLTWREHRLAETAGAADHPRVLAKNGRFFVFWNSAERPLGVMAFPGGEHGPL